MKKIFAIAMMAMLCIAGVYAQESKNEPAWIKKLYLSISTDVMLKSKNYETIGTEVQFGWKFTPNFYAFATFPSAVSLYEKDGYRTWLRHSNLGGGLGYRFVEDELGFDTLDLKASVSATVGNCDWHNTTYDLGIYTRVKRFTVGVGYRFLDSHTFGIKSHGNLYASIGFSL